MNCALCGFEFDPGQAAPACASCLMSNGCHMVRCPKCGYEVPAETRLARLGKSISDLINNRSRRNIGGSN
jgi:hypothetical protein